MAKSKTIICKHCGAKIAKSAKVCPHCGGKNKKPIFLRPWFLILMAVIVIGVIGSIGSNSGGTKKTGTVDGSQQSGSAQQADGSGTNQSGSDQAASNQASGQVSGDQADSAAGGAAAAEEKTIYRVGDILQDGDTQIVYVGSGDYQSDNEFLQPAEGNKYIFLEFAFTNTGKSDTMISSYSFDAYADGYSADHFFATDDDLSATLSAGRSTTGKIYFEVPADAQSIEIEYTPNVFLDRKIKFIYEGNQASGYVQQPNTARTEGAISVGGTFESSALRISYLSCEPYVSDNMFIQPKEGYHYVTLSFEFENLGSSDFMASSLLFDCYADGIACDSTLVRDDNLSATISAGRKAMGTVTFEVPDSAEVIEAEFNNNVWTSNRVAFTVK